MTGMVTAPLLWTRATPGLSSGPGRSGAIIHLQRKKKRKKKNKIKNAGSASSYFLSNNVKIKIYKTAKYLSFIWV
jgi:hypothetical protein